VFPSKSRLGWLGTTCEAWVIGLKGTKNGKLLDAFEARGFEAAISNDKNLEFDQNL